MTDTNPQQAARYRKRPVEVDAIQWTGDNTQALSAFCSPFDFQTVDPEDRIDDPDQTAAVRESEHGTWRGLAPGDWVARRGLDLFECGAADFAKLYEPAAASAPVSPAPTELSPAGQSPASLTTLREFIARAIHANRFPDNRWDDLPETLRDDYRSVADAVLAVLPEPAGRAALSDAERTMLTYALDQAQERIWSEDGFTDEDQAAVDSLRRLADAASGPGGVAGETQQPEGEPIVQATKYTVNCLPEDGIDSHVFALTVEYRGAGRWGVYRNAHCCLGADGTWSYGYAWRDGSQEPSGDEEWTEYHAGREAWLDAHRFDEETALRLAKEHAPKVTVNGYTVTDALRMAEPPAAVSQPDGEA